MRRCFYFDKKTQSMVEGYPPQPEKFGTAPYVIGDTIEAYYHPGAGIWTESKRQIEQLDRATNCITTDKRIRPAPPKTDYLQEKAREEDISRALKAATEAVDSGAREFSEAEKAFHKQENERMSREGNFDAFNILGKKKNVKRRKPRARSTTGKASN